MPGRNIRLYLVDGSSKGLTIAEIMNWTGHVMQVSRTDLATLLQRQEILRTGIYFLTGDDPDVPGQLMVYIGESDVVKQRLIQHSRPQDSGGKDFWDKVTVISSKDANLTKGHVRYLESRLIETATRAGMARLENQVASNPASLPEGDVADMEFFLEQVKIILPVLGLDILREIDLVGESNQPRDNGLGMGRNSPIFEIRPRRNNSLLALAQESNSEFIVKSGSQARREWSGASHGYQNLRQSLIDQKRLVPDETNDNVLVFTQDTIFKSPSAASAVILGRSDNGRKTWVAQGTGQSYDVWQSGLVAGLDSEEEAE